MNVTAVVRLTFCTSKLLAPQVSTALFWMVRVLLPPACPPPILQTPSVTVALSLMVTLALRLPPLVSRPNAVAPPVAPTTALEANCTEPRGTMKFLVPIKALPTKTKGPPSAPGRHCALLCKLVTLPAQVQVPLVAARQKSIALDPEMEKSFVTVTPLVSQTLPLV